MADRIVRDPSGLELGRIRELEFGKLKAYDRLETERRNAGAYAMKAQEEERRRLAAVSGLFSFWAMRDPAAPSPVPRGAAARRAAAGERSGLLAHLGKPKRRSGLRGREPRPALTRTSSSSIPPCLGRALTLARVSGAAPRPG